MLLGYPIESRHLLSRWGSMRMWLLMFLGYLITKRSAQSPTSLRVGWDCIRTQGCGGSHRHPSDGLHGVTKSSMNRDEYEGIGRVHSEDGGICQKDISKMDAFHRDAGFQGLLPLSCIPGSGAYLSSKPKASAPSQIQPQATRGSQRKHT